MRQRDVRSTEPVKHQRGEGMRQYRPPLSLFCSSPCCRHTPRRSRVELCASRTETPSSSSKPTRSTIRYVCRASMPRNADRHRTHRWDQARELRSERVSQGCRRWTSLDHTSRWHCREGHSQGGYAHLSRRSLQCTADSADDVLSKAMKKSA